VQASLMLFVAAMPSLSSAATVSVEIPSGLVVNTYTLNEVTDPSGQSLNYESIPVRVTDAFNQVVTVPAVDSPLLFAAIKALDEIKDSTYFYHDSN